MGSYKYLSIAIHHVGHETVERQDSPHTSTKKGKMSISASTPVEMMEHEDNMSHTRQLPDFALNGLKTKAPLESRREEYKMDGENVGYSFSLLFSFPNRSISN